MQVDMNSNCEWATTPDRCQINPEMYRDMVKAAIPALMASGGDMQTFWFVAWPMEFASDGEIFKIDAQEYSIDSCSLQVYKNGGCSLRLGFKYTNDEMWTNTFQLPT